MTAATQPKLWLFDFDNTLARLEPVVDWPALRAEVRAILERAHAPGKVTQQSPARATRSTSATAKMICARPAACECALSELLPTAMRAIG